MFIEKIGTDLGIFAVAKVQNAAINPPTAALGYAGQTNTFRRLQPIWNMKNLLTLFILTAIYLPLFAQNVDLELSATTADANPPAFSLVSVSITLHNAGDAPAANVVLSAPLATGLTYQGGAEFTASQGSFDVFTHTWNAGNVNGGASATLTLHYFTLNSNEKVVFAQITAQMPGDVDSTPGNGTPPTPHEDDETVIFLNKTVCKLQFQTTNLACNPANTLDNPADDTYSFDLTITSTGPCATTWNGPNGTTGTYNSTTAFGPYPISAGSQTLSFRDASDPLLVTNITVPVPPACSDTTDAAFVFSQVACGLSQPWEITYGPDDMLWVTESRNYHLTKIDPNTGETHTVIDLHNAKNFANNQYPWPQGGFTGLALHPQLLSGQPYVYLAYTYRFDGCLPGTQGCRFKTKVVRYTYNAVLQTLDNEQILCDTIPGSDDHNGGRLTIGPVNGVPCLFYSVGDMGAGQFSNADRAHHGQNPDYYEGKILRFRLEPDADAGLLDRWIPNDNPFNTFNRQNAVWTLGHRNPQGLAFGANEHLYQAEHGPYSDDEINLLAPGGNYGFPLVMGYADGNYNGSAAGTGAALPVIQDEISNAASLGSAYHDPIFSAFPANSAQVQEIYQNILQNTPPAPNYLYSWPSIAPSGLEYYGSDGIPGWKNSLLVASLKRAKIFRLQLSADGQSVVGDTVAFFAGLGRFRDVAVSPDGTTIYVAADSLGVTSGPTQGLVLQPANRGCILAFHYRPACAITAVFTEITCSDNNTSENSNDDFYYFKINLTANAGCGTQWSDDTLQGNYGTPVAFGPFAANQPPPVFRFFDTGHTFATAALTAPALLPCSVSGVTNPETAYTFQLAPNPAQQRTVVAFSTAKNIPAQILVYNSVGMVVFQSSAPLKESVSVETAAWPAGIYWVEAKWAEGTKAIRKLVVEE